MANLEDEMINLYHTNKYGIFDNIINDKEGTLYNNGISNELRDTYKKQKDYYQQLLGDDGVADEAARYYIGNKYDVTMINGTPEVTWYAPETFYGNAGMNYEVMRTRADVFVNVHSYQKPHGYIIAPDEYTQAEVKGKKAPSFLVYVFDEWGNLAPGIDLETNDYLRIGENVWDTEADKKASGVLEFEQKLGRINDAEQTLEVKTLLASLKNKRRALDQSDNE